MLNLLTRTLRSVSLVPPATDRVPRLTYFLDRCGYTVYELPDFQYTRHTTNHMIIVHPDDWTSAAFLFENEQGEIVVRPWKSREPFRALTRRLGEVTQEDFGLRLGGILKLRKGKPFTWKTWLSEASNS